MHNRDRAFWRPSGAVCLAPGPGDYRRPNRTPAESRTPHNCEEMSCHGGLCGTKQLFPGPFTHFGRVHEAVACLDVRQSESKCAQPGNSVIAITGY